MFGDDAQHSWPRWGEYDILDTWQMKIDGWSWEIWVCLKMVSTPKPNGFADHYPVFKWLFHWEYTLFSDKPIWGVDLAKFAAWKFERLPHLFSMLLFFPREPQPFAVGIEELSSRHSVQLRSRFTCWTMYLGQKRVMRTCGAMWLPAWPLNRNEIATVCGKLM